jgi:hypothetical protein
MNNPLHTSPEVPYLLEMEATQTRGEKILGVSLSGIFPSFFRYMGKPVRGGSEEELPDLPETARASRIIVIGETDFATNLINATQARQNLELLLRVADWLVSEDDIIGIRNRQPKTGRFDKISDPDMRMAMMRLTQIINVGFIPLLVIVIGLIRATRRAQSMRVIVNKSELETEPVNENEPQNESETKKENGDDI